MQLDSILDCLLRKGAGKRFYRFSNADGKTWIMPARNMQMAMNLYQPSGRNGKLVKSLFPRLHGIPFIRRTIHAETEHYRLSDEMEQLLGRLFQETELEFSVFGGTPCVHQKVTMQISKGRRILGYCKATANDEIAALFRSEADLLEALRRKGMEDIPECLFCNNLAGGVNLFVQSTVKTHRSRVVHDWGKLHDDFLQTLHRKSATKVRFEETDYFQTLAAFQKHIGWLPEPVDKELILSAIREILSQWRGKEMECSAYHADFTPWNMFVESGRLFVFDWEYARMTYPPLLDRYHFFTQTAIYEKHWQGNDFATFMGSPQGRWIDTKAYTLYLLDIMARFTLREKGNVKEDMARSMKIWNDILKYIQGNPMCSHRE